MARYGWVASVERCNYLDLPSGEKVFNVNLARPWAAEHEAKQDPRGPVLAEAGKKLGELFFPWSWKQVRWNFFAKDAAGAWNPVAARIAPGTSRELDAADVVGLRAAVRAEVDANCKQCERPFSQEMEDFWARDARSHVHALAPLTHWPALVSGKVLNLSFFVAVDPAVLGTATHVAAFPEFDIDPTDVLGAQMRLKNAKPSDPKYPLTNNSKVEIVADYQDASVAFLCLAACVTDVAFGQGTAKLTQGRATASAIRDSVQQELLPARLLRLWMEKAAAKDVRDLLDKKDVRDGLAASLWSALGIGREPREAGDNENVLELFLEPHQGEAARAVREGVKNFTPSSPQAAKAIVAAAGVLAGEREPVGAWNEEDRKRWALREDHLQFVAGIPKDGVNFAEAWASAAEVVLGHETGLELYGPWLAHAVNEPLSKEPKSDWDKIRAKLLLPRGVRADVMQRGRGSAISKDQWTQAKTLVHSMDPARPEEDAVKAAAALLKATLAHIEDVVGDAAYAALKPTLEPIVEIAVAEWAKHMHASIQRSRNRPRDRGIRIEFSKASTPGNSELQQLRGYAIALCGGVLTDTAKPWDADTTRAAWLTDTALRYERAPGKPDWLDVDGGNGTAWMHETVGATQNDGEVVVNVEYEGVPLAAPLTNADDSMPYDPGKDGFQSVDLAWRNSAASLPLMGFGMLYKAATTALDNAGGVVDEKFRLEVAQQGGSKAKQLAELAPAGQLDEFGNAQGALQYRSSEPPGAPVATAGAPKELYELSEETQAHAWQHRAKQDRPPKKVALLAHDTTHFPQAKSTCQMQFKPPRAQFAFIERWLNTDRVLIDAGKKEHVSDGRLKGYTAENLRLFIEKFRERTKQDVPVATPEYHPAVAALGIEVDAPGYQKAEAVEFQRLDEMTREPAKFQLKVVVDAKAADRVDLTVDKATATATVTIPPGRFACVRIYSLVSADHFAAGDLASRRFANGIQLPTVRGLEKWCAFGPAEHWFETLPVWDEQEFKDAAASLAFAGPRDESADKKVYVVSPNLMTAQIQFQGAPWVNWVKGLYVQRHEWHWTGYPVDFPGAKEPLEKWLPSLAGVESFRETADVTLSTSFDGANAWKLGPDKNDSVMFFRHELVAGRRPARYVAVFARPMIRFRRWLNPKIGAAGPAALERRIWGGGLLVAGRAEPGAAERLPVPVLRHSIPLTATYAASAKFSREANGALLVFDEAIRRTDDLARLGGVGDVFEVDLVETRVAEFPEIGNNPIFHGAQGPWTEDEPLRLEVKPPIGLTFDIGTNAKVAQTALIVQPVNAGGHWILAKARVRRAVLPETELGTGVAQAREEPDPPNAAVKAWYSLTNRIEGDDTVPPDVVIDTGSGKVPAVRIRIGSKDQAVAMPKTAGSRYVISWHRARWGDVGAPLPAWRCQVLAQECDAGSMTWRTVDKASGHANVACELPQAYRESQVYIGIDAAPPATTLSRIRLSDYTDPVWLTFIGSFGQEKPDTADSFVFGRDKNGALELQWRGDDSEQLPVLRGLDDCLNDDDDPRWHLVLAFRAAKDVTRGKAGREGGVLVAAFRKRGGKFELLPQKPGEAEPDLRGCRAHVVALQRVNALSKSDAYNLARIDSLPKLLDTIFPAQPPNGAVESLMRFLPEYLGPIEVLA